MKLTKTELKNMIRECLREELKAHKTLKESLWTCYYDDREMGTVEAVSEEEALDNMMAKYPELNYGLYDGCYYVEPLQSGQDENGSRIAYIDQTGSLISTYDLLAKRVQADGFDGTVKTVEDTFMEEMQADVKRGCDVTLYTCNNDYLYDCPDIVDAPNFHVVMVPLR